MREGRRKVGEGGRRKREGGGRERGGREATSSGGEGGRREEREGGRKEGNDLTLPPQEGESLLHKAVMMNDVDSIKVLVKHGAPLNVYNNNNLTPLHIACIAGQSKLVKMLMEHGALCDEPTRETVSVVPTF
jgi:hypothetical protein